MRMRVPHALPALLLLLLLAVAGSGAMRCEQSTVAPGSTHAYRARLLNAAGAVVGESAPAAAYAHSVPPAPAGVRASLTDVRYVTVRWDPRPPGSPHAVDGYEVLVDGAPATASPLPAAPTRFSFAYPPEAAPASVSVRAVNALGRGLASAPVRVEGLPGPSPGVSRSPSPSATPTPSATPSPPPTPSATPSPPPTPSATPSPPPTPSATPRPSPTPSATPRPSPSPPPTPSATPSPPPTPSATPSPPPTPSATPSPPPTPSTTPRPSPSATPSVTPTASPSSVPSPTSTPSPTASPSPTPLPTPSAPLPGAPTNLTIASNSHVAHSIAWGAPAGAASYVVYAGGTRIARTLVEPFYNLSSPAPNTAFVYSVAAIAASPGGGEGANATITVWSPPAAPAGAATGAVTATSIQVSWSASAGATAYRVYRAGLAAQLASVASSPATITGLSFGTAYSFEVAAYSTLSGVEGARSAATAPRYTLTGATAPPALSSPNATAISATWTATPDAFGYNVYRGAAFVARVTSPSFTEAGLTPATSYSYAVAALNGDGAEGSRSATVSLATRPGPPASASATVFSLTSVRVAWSAPVPSLAVTSYTVYQTPGAIAYGPLAAANLSVVATGLSTGVTYAFEVRATTSGGEGAGTSASATPDVKPSPPTAVSVSIVDTTRLNVSWSGAAMVSDPIAGYYVYRNGTRVSPLVAGPSFVDAELVTGTTYAYAVSAVNSFGESAPSTAPASAAPDVFATPPTSVTATTINAAAVSVVWSAASSAGTPVQGYYVYRNGTRVSPLVAGLAYTDAGLYGPAAYAYTVSAVNGRGESSRSSASSTATTPTPVELMLRFTFTGADQSWTVPPGAMNIRAKLWGAGGGYGAYGGGGGGFVSGTLDVSPGTTLRVIVGGRGRATGGTAPLAVVYGGGGYALTTSTTNIASGGGRSAIRLFNGTDDIITAGGGGGGGSYYAGGVGGGLTGGRPSSLAQSGGGGTQTSGGAAGSDAGFSAGSQYAGGTFSTTGYGGGGGGGYYGGGSGARGGGGGSSYYGSPIVSNGYTVSGSGATAGNTADADYQSPWGTGSYLGKYEGDHGGAVIRYSLPTPAVTPPTLSSPNATAISGTWEAVPGVVGYNVYRGGAFAARVTSPSFAEAGLTPATSYSYAVAALNVDGAESARSATVSLATRPGPPASASATVLSPTSVRVDWAAPVPSTAVTSYTVYQTPGAIAHGPFAAANLSAVATGLSPGVTYAFEVRATTSGGEGAGTSASAMPDVKPSPPTAVSASIVDTTRLNVSWSGAATVSDPIAGYYVYRNGTRVSPLVAGPSYVDAGLVTGTVYAYAVSAVNAFGESAPSTAPASAAPDVFATPPTSVTATTINTTAVSVVWSAASSAGTPVRGYYVYRDGTRVSPLVADTSYTDAGLDGATPYAYTVSVLNGRGESSRSSASSTATTLTPSAWIFDYTGADQRWVAPPGFTSVWVKLWGAGGGSASSNGRYGGAGGFTSGLMSVTPGQAYTVIVGQGGRPSTVSASATYGGGGGVQTAGSYVGTGGGRSAIRLFGGADDIITAGGGGAGGASLGIGGGSNGGDGGVGGGLVGGRHTFASAAYGGTQTAGGLAGSEGQAGAKYAGGFKPYAPNNGGGGGGGGYYGGGSGYYGTGGGSGYFGDARIANGATVVGGNGATGGSAANGFDRDYLAPVAVGGRLSTVGGNGRIVIVPFANGVQVANLSATAGSTVADSAVGSYACVVSWAVPPSAAGDTFRVWVNGVTFGTTTANSTVVTGLAASSAYVITVASPRTIPASVTYAVANPLPLDAPALATAIPPANLRACYATRRLRIGYVGPTLRLVRSDGTAQDFYADEQGNLNTAFNRMGTSYAAWIAGRNATVATWYDQSGLGLHASQGTSAARPAYTGARVGFETVDAFLSAWAVTMMPSAQKAYTIHYRGTNRDPVYAYRTPVSFGNSATASSSASVAVDGEGYPWFFTGNGTDYAGNFRLANASSFQMLPNSRYAVTTAVNAASTTGTLALNLSPTGGGGNRNASLGVPNLGFFAYSSASATLSLGRTIHSDAWLGQWTGELDEVLVVDRTLTLAEMQTLHGLTAVPEPVPSPPTTVAALASGATAVSVSWGGAASAGDAIQGYYVYRNGIKVSPLVAGTSYADAGLVAGTPYVYTVSAKNSAGESAPSAASATATPGA